MMKEISLKLKYIPADPTAWSREMPDLSRESIIEDIVNKVNNKEVVYIKFGDKHHSRSGSIAIIRKIEDISSCSYTSYNEENRPSHYEFTLKWDDRKNTTKIKINHEDCYYLPDYKGNTVWTMFDKKQFAKDNAKPVYDRLKQNLERLELKELI